MSENTHTPAPHRVTVEVGGRTLTLETGKIAKQANGAIVARYGDTVLLTTACMASAMNDWPWRVSWALELTAASSAISTS